MNALSGDTQFNREQRKKTGDYIKLHAVDTMNIRVHSSKWNQVNDNHNNNNENENENGFLFVICFPLIYFYGIAFFVPFAALILFDFN